MDGDRAKHNRQVQSELLEKEQQQDKDEVLQENVNQVNNQPQRQQKGGVQEKNQDDEATKNQHENDQYIHPEDVAPSHHLQDQGYHQRRGYYGNFNGYNRQNDSDKQRNSNWNNDRHRNYYNRSQTGTHSSRNYMNSHLNLDRAEYSRNLNNYNQGYHRANGQDYRRDRVHYDRTHIDYHRGYVRDQSRDHSRYDQNRSDYHQRCDFNKGRNNSRGSWDYCRECDHENNRNRSKDQNYPSTTNDRRRNCNRGSVKSLPYYTNNYIVSALAFKDGSYIFKQYQKKYISLFQITPALPQAANFPIMQSAGYLGLYQGISQNHQQLAASFPNFLNYRSPLFLV